MESAESSISEEICKGTLIVVSQKSQKHKNYNLLDTTASNITAVVHILKD
jgi:hypothetical protein